MERKIGETFEYEGKILQVKANSHVGCKGCFFDGKCTRGNKSITGDCGDTMRDDSTEVIFVEVQEQPQKLNLCKVLKDCPTGTVFYSTLHGKVNFVRIDEEEHPIIFMFTDKGVEFTSRVSSEGKYLYSTIGECILFPSKDQRDWSKFTAPWFKKEKFDPKTLKPFDSVLVYGEYEGWFCTIFSHIGVGEYPYNTASGNYGWCIPYNDDTKHLVGTTDEAPEFYKYWEE